MLDLDPDTLEPADRYKLLIGAIVPRPIALVSTIAPEAPHALNLAPFSFFNGVGSNPMCLLFCPANRPDGGEKDTLRNCKPAAEGGLGEFVVNIVPAAIADRTVACAEELAYGQSEFDLAGLTPEPSRLVRPPRVAESPISFECRTVEVIRTNPGQPGGGNIVIGRVVRVIARDGLVNERYHVDPDLLDGVGRMGGLSYCTTRQRFTLPFGRAALGQVVPPARSP
jgi:flavin reductase (DIM6/NTAB) family NADH-FMN oxidoreductase RutF